MLQRSKMCNIIHKTREKSLTNLKEIKMFEFEKYYKDAVKKTEEVVESVKQANEFWINAVLSSLKSFYKSK